MPPTPKWDRERVAQALAEWLSQLDDGVASSSEYRAFERGRHDYPSMARVYELFDGWSDALEQAVERSETLSADDVESSRNDIISACPTCDRAQLSERKTLEPRYRCVACGAEFAEPVLRSPKKPSGRAQTSSEEIQAAIQAAADARGEPLRIADYEAWRADQDDDSLLNGYYIRDREEGWAPACWAAGVEPGKDPGV